MREATLVIAALVCTSCTAASEVRARQATVDWSYASGVDRMTGVRWAEACHVAAPQGGQQIAEENAPLLCVEKSGGAATISITVPKVVLDCKDEDGSTQLCDLSARFDGAPATLIVGKRPADDRFDQLVELSTLSKDAALHTEPVLRSVLQARHVAVQVPVYQGGFPVIDFDLTGLDLKRIQVSI